MTPNCIIPSSFPWTLLSSQMNHTMKTTWSKPFILCDATPKLLHSLSDPTKSTSLGLWISYSTISELIPFFLPLPCSSTAASISSIWILYPVSLYESLHGIGLLFLSFACLTFSSLLFLLLKWYEFLGSYELSTTDYLYGWLDYLYMIR